MEQHVSDPKVQNKFSKDKLRNALQSGYILVDSHLTCHRRANSRTPNGNTRAAPPHRHRCNRSVRSNRAANTNRQSGRLESGGQMKQSSRHGMKLTANTNESSSRSKNVSFMSMKRLKQKIYKIQSQLQVVAKRAQHSVTGCCPHTVELKNLSAKLTGNCIKAYLKQTANYPKLNCPIKDREHGFPNCILVELLHD